MSASDLNPPRSRAGRIVMRIVLGVGVILALYMLVALLLVAFGVWGGE
jgi:hypothetical protein